MEPIENLSSEEIKARRRLIKLCVGIAENFGHEVGMPCNIVPENQP
jgi:hypothetical protein